MKEILKLKRAIILIDDFYVPGKPFRLRFLSGYEIRPELHKRPD